MDTTDITLVNVSDGWKEGPATVHFRHYHTAAVTPSGLLLVGGYRVGGLGDVVLLLGSGYVQGYRVGGVVQGYRGTGWVDLGYSVGAKLTKKEKNQQFKAETSTELVPLDGSASEEAFTLQTGGKKTNEKRHFHQIGINLI